MPDEPGLTLEQRERVYREVLGRTDKFPIPSFRNWHWFGEIVDAMREQGWSYYVEAADVGGHRVVFERGSPIVSGVAEYLNPTVAAALAALKAKEAG